MDDMGYDKLCQQNAYLASVHQYNNLMQALSISTIILHAVMDYIMCTESRCRELFFHCLSTGVWINEIFSDWFLTGLCLFVHMLPAQFPGLKPKCRNMSGLVALPWSLIYLIRVSLALEIGFPKTPPICHWSEKQIVPPQTHAIGGADVSILSWSGCSKKLSNCWIQNHILSCYSFYHLSMAEIVWVVWRYVVPNSANVLMGESIFTLKKRHTLALNTSLQNHWSLLKKKNKKKLDQGLNLAIGFAVQSSSLQGSPINVRGENAVEQANINHNHHENNTRLCNTTIQVRVT